MDSAIIKKDIFVAIVSNGSTAQKECWKQTAQEVFEWVMADDTAKAPKAKAKK